MALIVTVSPIAHLVGLRPNLAFHEPGQSVIRTFAPFNSDVPFNEAIVSWNVSDPSDAALIVKARAAIGAHQTAWYTMADWAGDAGRHVRASVDHQSDVDGRVSTDTLHLFQAANSLEIEVTMTTLPGSTGRPSLNLLAVSFSNTADTFHNVDQTVSSPAWGKTIDVPERAQNNYPKGGVLCSPTSVSMMLWHYSKHLSRPDWDRDVPDVEAGVWDSVYRGAGNWPFNTAYAGGLPGMEAYVARFTSLEDLETWIAAGLPVVCSVSFDMIQGKPLSPGESGHLVVLVGFTKDGDPVFNDPAWKSHVRTTYKRADFIKAWDYGHKTVYLIFPKGTPLPPDPRHLWTVP